MENKLTPINHDKDISVMPYDEIKSMFCPNATDKEIDFFINIAKANNLNPFKREIHITKYNTNVKQFDGSFKTVPVFKIIVGYEVYLKRAERTEKMNGWKCEIVHAEKPENDKAVITINRKDWTEPFIWEVTRKEVSKGQATWSQMPDFMLKKVVIAQGMRLCFPDEMGGMPYIEEETGYQDKGKPVVEPPKAIEAEEIDPPAKDDVDIPPEEPKPVKKPVTKKEEFAPNGYGIKIAGMINKSKDIGKMTNYIIEKYQINTFAELKKSEAEEIIKNLEGGKDTW